MRDLRLWIYAHPVPFDEELILIIMRPEIMKKHPEAVRALTFMRDQIARSKIAPNDVLTWHEEETRFAFQNGRAVLLSGDARDPDGRRAPDRPRDR